MLITLPDVPPPFPNPRFDDDIVQQIQIELATLPWMERAYHIARVGIIAKDNLGYPQIQANNSTSEVFDIRPDNNVKAYSFFEVDKPYELDFYAKESKYFLSIVFWGNLTLIDNTITTDFTSTLIQDVIKILGMRGSGDIVVEENPEKIFEKYSGLTQNMDQFLLKKYMGFKVTFSIITGFTNDCP